MDLAINYNSRTLSFGLSLAGADLASDQGLRSAVLVSLLTDRRANDDDVLPGAPEDTNRRGSWDDAWPEADGDLQGSRLWLLTRSKQIPDVLERAKAYSEEALAWLIEDGVAQAVAVNADWVEGPSSGALRGVLGLHVAVRLISGSLFADVFNYSLGG